MSLTLLEFVVLLVVAGICGAIGQAIAGYSRGGCIGAIAVGFVGALLGVAISRWLKLPELISVKVGAVLGFLMRRSD
jgi:uncharacterized membrane protein YeaQ/YmgE (transglycosylase-associated protein family)